MVSGISAAFAGFTASLSRHFSPSACSFDTVVAARFEAKHFALDAARFMDGTCPVCIIDNSSVIAAALTGAAVPIAKAGSKDPLPLHMYYMAFGGVAPMELKSITALMCTMANQARWDDMVEIPRDYALFDDEVHVWRTRVDWPTERIRDMMETLSSEEREKAGRFHFAADRTRHIVGRALLRLLFGRLLGTAPASLRFSYNAFGKPGFPVDSLEHRMRFNISHAGDMILIGLSVDRAIGVDVERVRRDLDVEGIARRFFSAREQVEWARLDTGARHDAFFRCWCRREAFAKAQGEGWFLPSDKFDVPLLPNKQATLLLATRPDPTECDMWVLQDLNVGPGYKASLAVERAGWTLKAWEFLPGLCSATIWRDITAG